MKKICIVSNLHLCTNPRVWKEANTLANAGYEVVILAIWTSAEKKKRDVLLINNKNIHYKAAINLVPGEAHPVKRFYYRARRKLSMLAKVKLNFTSTWVIDYNPGKMAQAALAENADLYICHTEYGMLVGKSLINRNKNVAFDIEDWYSQDYLGALRPVQLLQQIEKFALERGAYCTCPSVSMAEALQKAYNTNRKPEVVYNGFSVSESNGIAFGAENKNGKLPSLIWFSQTVGAGRGLEKLFLALAQVNTAVQVHLIGNCSQEYKDQATKLFPFSNGHQLFFYPQVNHDKLLHELSKHDIGLALEPTSPENKNTTISNKILQYLQAGLKILATDTAGQKEVARLFPQSVEIVLANNPGTWEQHIEKIIRAQIDKKSQQQGFNELYSWEMQEKKLLSLVAAALKN